MKMSKLTKTVLDRTRHPLQLRQSEGNPNNDKNDDNDKNDKIDTDYRTGTNEYRHPDPSSHFAKCLYHRLYFELISCTDISECRARDEE